MTHTVTDGRRLRRLIVERVAAMKQRIRDLLLVVPFQPFVIRMAGGREYRVEHPDLVQAAASDVRQVTLEDPDGSQHYLSALLASSSENAVTQAGKGAEAGVESHQLGVRSERESGKIGVLPAFGLVGKRGAESAEMKLKTFRLVVKAETLVPEERVPRFPSLGSALYIGAHARGLLSSRSRPSWLRRQRITSPSF